MSILPPDHPPIKIASPDSHSYPLWRDAGRWIGAGIIVLTVHAAGAYAVHVTQEDDQPDGGQVAAMLVELAPEPMAPAEEQVSEVAQEETATEPEETVEPEDVPQEEQKPEPEPEPEPVMEPVQEPEPVDEPEETIPDVTEAPMPELVVPVPAEKPEIKPEKPKVEKPKPEKSKQVKQAEKSKPKPVKKAKKTRQASAPRIDADSGSKAVANRKGQSSVSPGASSAKWTSKLQAHMARNVRFLQRKSRNAKGLVRVTFVIDPSGNVLSARLAGSSGDSSVDQLALEAARRASPVPAPPTAMAKARMPITLPLLFK
ncbi:energy transducer TonB [Falsochrobactrum sp. TDYN1]|uniref:Energy transducer TonB n=1 Tax=Falsochrobactrum tianjinense TaxID=2706015 RepID=A0A949PQS2_9HYPH|nr:energy transducer TonB [Falsochrobactrum sp. TDYN1]MBV2144685.1 energy transducer TonB [Falsochrobactrum sp. TDYN1]